MMTPRWIHYMFVVAALTGIFGWGFLIILFSWWLVQPVSLPIVKEPIPVLNLGNRVAVGSNLVLKLDVDKAVPLTPVDSSRYIACESGTLITLTSHPIKLPVGQYEIISDDVKIPDQITPGDICVYEISITFDVNPIRHEAVDFKSESFTVLPEQ